MRKQYLCCFLCSLIGVIAALLMLFAAPQQVAAQGAVSFIKDVAPILKDNCFACHDAKQRKGKLDMTSFEKFRTGGTKDDPIIPGMANISVLNFVLTDKGVARMPPADAGDALPKEQIDLIARWIDQGAKLDAGIDPKADLRKELRSRWQPPTPPVAYKYPININALAFTPDSKKLVVGGYHEVTIWDVASGKLEKRLYTRSERAYKMAFLPDGKLVIAGGRPGQEGNVRIYNLGGTAKMADGVAMLDGVNDKSVLLKEFVDADDVMLALGISPDGKKLAAAGCDRLVRVWDISAGFENAKLEQSIENHADWIFGLAFSPDGKNIATASRDKSAKVWNLEKKESVLTFPDHQQGVYDVAFLPDGKTGLSVAEDNNIRFWDAVADSKNVGKQTRTSGGHGKAVFQIAFSGDAKNPLIATCSADGTVRTWNPISGAALKTMSGHTDWVYAVAVSPDGTLVAAGSWNGEVRIWKTADGAVVQAFNASPGYVAPAAAEVKKN